MEGLVTILQNSELCYQCSKRFENVLGGAHRRTVAQKNGLELVINQRPKAVFHPASLRKCRRRCERQATKPQNAHGSAPNRGFPLLPSPRATPCSPKSGGASPKNKNKIFFSNFFFRKKIPEKKKLKIFQNLKIENVKKSQFFSNGILKFPLQIFNFFFENFHFFSRKIPDFFKI